MKHTTNTNMRPCIVFLLGFLFLLGCQKEIGSEDHETKRITEKYLKKAEDKNLSFPVRTSYNDTAFMLLQKLENDTLVRRAMLNVSWNYRQLYCREKLKTAALYTKKLSEEGKDSVYRGFAYKYLGYYYTDTSNNDTALYWFAKEREMLGKSKKHRYILGLIYDIAQVEYFMCDYAGAEAAYLKMLELATAKKSYWYQYVALAQLGHIHNYLGEYKKAEEYTIKALEAVKKDKDSETAYKEVLNDLGYNLQLQGNYKKALDYFLESQKMIKIPADYPELYALNLDNIASIKLKFGQLEEAKAIFEEAYALRKQLNIEQGINYNRLYLADYYIKKNDTVRAVGLANEALVLSKQFKAPHDVIDCLKFLIKVDKKNGSLIKEYIKVTDSTQAAERKNRNKFARIIFEADQLVIEKEQAVKTMWLIILCAALVIIFTCLLVLIRFNSIKEKELAFEREQQKSDDDMYRLVHDQQNKIDAARKKEKARIAKELHDGIMNKLSAIRLNLFVLSKKRDDATIDKCLDYISEIQNVEMELRTVAHDLTIQDTKWENGFGELLENFYNDQRDIVTANIHMKVDQIDWSEVGNDIKINIFRILQETVGNAAKYSDAHDIWISIYSKKGKVGIEVRDNGIGFNLKKSLSGLGLKSIRERVNELNGSINIESTAEKGTAIEIII